MIINNVIFNAELYEILDEVDRQRALYGLSPFTKRRDSKNDIQICCPYHNEHRPSAGISKFDIRRDDGKLIPAGTFHCFACGETHTLPELISHCFEKYDDTLGKFGWQWLLKNFATLKVEDRKIKRHEFKRGQKIEEEKPVYVSEEELDKYRYYHPYWTERGITDEKIIEMFDLGFSIADDCITFPIRDINGNCLFVAKRSVKTKFFHYPDGVTKPLYGLYEYHKLCTTRVVGGRCNGKTEFLRRLNAVVVCESMIDCLRLWQNGKFAVALNGLGNDIQMQQLRDLPCRKLIIATDNDKAGRSARERIKNEVKNKIITYYEIPNGKKDIGECTDDEIRQLKEYF